MTKAKTKTIMILDDSSSLRQVLALSLGRAGYAVVEAENGVDALGKLKNEERIDLIISDINMPEMDGLDFVSHIREIETLKYVPIIMLTTESGEEKKMRGLEMGVKAWLTKPFMPEQLLDLVSKTLGN